MNAPIVRFGLVLALIGTPFLGWASAEYNFDFSSIHADHGFGSFSGSSGSMRYYLDDQETGTGLGVSISGWQARSNTRNFVNRTNRLKNFGSLGFGLDQSESGVQEAFDNSGRYDLVIFEFDQLVSLDEIGLGWIYNDADISVLAHTGPGGPTLDNGSFRYDPNHRKGMTAQGWELIGSYDNSGYDVQVNNSGRVMSSVWAIGAYTSALVGNVYGAPNAGDDYFLLQSLALSSAATAVAEPGTYMLLIGGLAFVGLRRRQARTARAGLCPHHA